MIKKLSSISYVIFKLRYEWKFADLEKASTEDLKYYRLFDCHETFHLVSC